MSDGVDCPKIAEEISNSEQVLSRILRFVILLVKSWCARTKDLHPNIRFPGPESELALIHFLDQHTQNTPSRFVCACPVQHVFDGPEHTLKMDRVAVEEASPHLSQIHQRSQFRF